MGKVGPQQRYKWGRLHSVWVWATGHFFRWVQAAKWAKRRMEKAKTPADRDKWRHVHEEYVRKRKAGRKHRNNGKDGWPDHMVIEELFTNDNGLRNHVHVASPNRDALIAVAKIAAARYGEVYIREFPPFDHVDCVHAICSWHYRDSSSPYTCKSCGAGNGCAFDLSAPINEREAFAREVRSHYGANRCDF